MNCHSACHNKARGLPAKLANKAWMFLTVIPWFQTFQFGIAPSNSSSSVISEKNPTRPHSPDAIFVFC